jgi:hypothetical protein
LIIRNAASYLDRTIGASFIDDAPDAAALMGEIVHTRR